MHKGIKKGKSLLLHFHWYPKDEKHQLQSTKYNQKITDSIALGSQPFTVTEDSGFCKLIVLFKKCLVNATVRDIYQKNVQKLQLIFSIFINF